MHVSAPLGSAPFGRRIWLVVLPWTTRCVYRRIRGSWLADPSDSWGTHEDDE